MSRLSRNFCDRSIEEQKFLIENTWCNHCGKADLGLTDPIEYDKDGRVFIEGKCRSCQRVVKNEVIEEEIQY